MKKIVLCLLFLIIYLNCFSQKDSSTNKIKIGMSISYFSTSITILGDAFGAGGRFSYSFASLTLEPVFISELKKVKEPCTTQFCDPSGPPNVWQRATPDRLGLNGFSVHFRIIPLYQKKISPIAGVNYNYLNRLDRGGGTGDRLIDYEILFTGGAQFVFFKKSFIITPELGLGVGTGATHFFGPGGEQGKSAMSKISLAYLFKIKNK